MAPDRSIVGVDIGGTKVAAGLLRARLPRTGSGARVERETPVLVRRFGAATSTGSADACLAGVIACIDEVVGGSRVDAIGVGVASMVDVAAGRVVESVNLPLADVPLRDLLRRRYGVPVAVDNDATAAAVGEHLWGAGAGSSEMLMLTLGTGVGGGIICGGRPYRGASGAAAELGHLTLDMDGPPCTGECPNRGCLEAYVSGTAMGLAALEAARAEPGSALGRALAAGEPVDSRTLTRLALAGDPPALALVTRAGERLGAGLVTLSNIFDPEVIVVGGGAAAAGELLLTPARRMLAERALPPARDRVRVVPAALGGDAGMVGAAALALLEASGETG